MDFKEETFAMDGVLEQRRDWLPGSFFRRPAWRWLRAGHLAPNHRRLDGRIDDLWVARARMFLRAGTRWPSAEKEIRAAISAAHELWSSGLSLLRAKVESYLLTCLPFERISSNCGLAPNVIEAYHEIYFDVRSKRSATDWLLRQAVCWRPSNDAGPPDVGRLWRYLAAIGGEEVLEAVIAVTTNAPLPVRITNTFMDPELDETRFRLITKLAICSLTANTPQASKELVSLRRRLRKLETINGEESTGDKVLSEMVAFLAAATKRPRRAAHPVDEDACPSHSELLVNLDEQLGTSTAQRREPIIPLDETDTMNMPSGSSVATDVPISVLDPLKHSWRSFNEDPDPVDGIVFDRERCRVYLAEPG